MQQLDECEQKGKCEQTSPLTFGLCTGVEQQTYLCAYRQMLKPSSFSSIEGGNLFSTEPLSHVIKISEAVSLFLLVTSGSMQWCLWTQKKIQLDDLSYFKKFFFPLCRVSQINQKQRASHSNFFTLKLLILVNIKILSAKYVFPSVLLSRYGVLHMTCFNSSPRHNKLCNILNRKWQTIKLCWFYKSYSSHCRVTIFYPAAHGLWKNKPS